MVAPLIAALLAGGAGLTAGHLMSRPEAKPIAAAPGLVPFDNGQGEGGVIGNISPDLNVPSTPITVNPTAQDVNALGPVNTAANPGYAALEADLLPLTDLNGNSIAPFNAAKNAPANNGASVTAAPSSTDGLTLEDVATPLGNQQRNLANVEEFPESLGDQIIGKGLVLSQQSIKEGQEAYNNADQGGSIIETTQNAFEAPGGLKEVLMNGAKELNIETLDKLKGALKETGGNIVDFYDQVRDILGNNAYIGRPQGPSSFNEDRPGEPAATAPPIASNPLARPNVSPSTTDVGDPITDFGNIITTTPSTAPAGLEHSEPPPVLSPDQEAGELAKAAVGGDDEALQRVVNLLSVDPAGLDVELQRLIQALQPYKGTLLNFHARGYGNIPRS